RGLSADGDHVLPLASLNHLMMQSGIKVTAARIVPALAVLALVAFTALRVFRGDLLEALAGTAVAVTVLPFLALLYLRKRRRDSFGAQFPEAIDIIVRSLRAGHPVPVAISMVARELPDPVGSEFGIVADEITYGSDLETAMRNMYYRVGQEDLPLFVTSVAIQATTGGNLSQILDNLSKVIRERFKMRRKVKGLSSEGRASAWILTLTPIIVFALVNVLSPDFYGAVWNEQATKIGLGTAMVWMFIGNLIMRRMINFKI
ncbi:MAG: type II secretion system F family protein, partial [Pseudomonadota bacterium]|nr:type II secretion system F family protein [Pseudomonadota bacterium]